MKTPFMIWLPAVGLFGFTLSADEPIQPLTLAYQAAGNFQTDQRNYLLPLQTLRQHRADYLGSPEQAGQYWQALATYASLADEVDSATYAWYQQPGYRQLLDPGSWRAVAAMATQPAQAAILAQTRKRQVVIFNENHIQPKGRWLLGSILPGLRKQGFRYLALEALADTDTMGVRRRGYPLANSGFYTNEPHFANLIRLARTLGFTIVAYDAMSADRERDQARNIMAATLTPDSAARVVVLAGHGHIDERSGASAKSMAQWMHQLSSIDPLTIDQTQLANLPVSSKLRSRAYVVTNAQAYLRPEALRADLYLLNNIEVDNSNNFGQPAGRTVRIPLPADSSRAGQAQVVLVYRQTEKQSFINPVPVAVHCLQPGEKEPVFTLLPDTYTVELRDAQGRRNWQHSLPIR
jgi:hypothetical protein